MLEKSKIKNSLSVFFHADETQLNEYSCNKTNVFKISKLFFFFFLLQYLPSLLEIPPEYVSYQKMAEWVPSRGRFQLGKIPRYGEQVSVNINDTAVWRRELRLLKAHINTYSKYSLKVKGAPLGRKSLNIVAFNKVIFISIESESQSKLDLHKIHPDDLLVSSK